MSVGKEVEQPSSNVSFMKTYNETSLGLMTVEKLRSGGWVRLIRSRCRSIFRFAAVLSLLGSLSTHGQSDVPAGSASTIPLPSLKTLQEKVALSLSYFRRSDEAAALAALDPAPGRSRTAPEEISFGWSLAQVAQRLRAEKQFPLARKVATIASDHLTEASPVVARAEPKLRAVGLEIAAMLAETIFNDRATARKQYQASWQLDSARLVAKARWEKLQGLADRGELPRD